MNNISEPFHNADEMQASKYDADTRAASTYTQWDAYFMERERMGTACTQQFSVLQRSEFYFLKVKPSQLQNIR